MTGTVHQCLFCPQTFASAVDKDDHILEHFPQEICTDCDQSLIRIGKNLYTLHNAVTCTKRESKPDALSLNKGRIGTVHDESVNNDTFTSAHRICDQEMCIKDESEDQNEKFPCVDMIDFPPVFDAVPMNTVSAQQMEFKVEPETLMEQSTHAKVKKITGSSSQVYQSTVGTVPLLQKTSDKQKSDHEKPKLRRQYQRASCKICAKLVDKRCMNKHVRAHQKYEIVFDQYQCDICKRFIQKKFSLIAHMKNKHGRKCKEFKCQHCSRIFSGKQCLDYHQVKNICRGQNNQGNKKTSTEKRYVCEICGAKYTQPSAVKTHQYRKHNMGGHSCVRCNQVFFTANGLINHEAHCVERSFECFLCHRVCPSKPALALHLHAKHDSSEKKKFICEVCNRCFSCLAALQSHKTRIHMNLDIRNFVCATCERAFRNKYNLEQHTLIHTGERPFQCSYDGCSKTFRTSSVLGAHLKIHRGEKQFRCRIDGCTEEFGGPAGYKKHRWIAHGIPIINKK